MVLLFNWSMLIPNTLDVLSELVTMVLFVDLSIVYPIRSEYGD